MSEEKDQGEESENDVKDLSDEFEFYFSFTKPLVLELPSSEDRVIAAAWVQKLETETEDKERLNYLKLLLFILQRGRLSGIFKKQPPAGPFEPFPQGFSIIDMGNLMLDQDDGPMFGGGDARAVPYSVEISNDLREFAASQEVPNFGIQMYYAWSADDPIQKWAAFDEDKFPQYILDKIKQLRESRSNEKTDETKCSRKKGFDLTRTDKYCNKKVKSPQEIEKSQGRSFHTYMGLVGRMGNFNKCNDDQDQFDRQDPRKGKPQRKGCQRRVPECGGEAEDMPQEDDYETFVSGLGGGSPNQNKSCRCPFPSHRKDCPELLEGGPQSLENQQPNVPSSAESRCSPANRSVRQASPKRCLREQNPEGVSPMQRCGGPMSQRGPGSSNRTNFQEDNHMEPPNKGGYCICSSQTCTCPCPRSASMGMSPSFGGATSSAGAEEPVCLNRTYVKPRPQELTTGNRYIDSSFRTPENCMSRQSPITSTPIKSRTRPNTGLKPEKPISHCYDERNPDPSLTQVSSRQPTPLSSSIYGTTPPQSPEGVCKGRRRPFVPLAESTIMPGHGYDHPNMSMNYSAIPPYNPEAAEGECEGGGNQQQFQNFMDSDDEPEFLEVYQNDQCGPVTRYKKPAKKFYGNSPLTVRRNLFPPEDAPERNMRGGPMKSPQCNDNIPVCPANTPVNSFPKGSYDNGGMAGNFNDACSPNQVQDPKMFYSPKACTRDRANFREGPSSQQSSPGISPSQLAEYFPLRTPSPMQRQTEIPCDEFMSFEPGSECGYQEDNRQYDTGSTATNYGEQREEMVYYSPPISRHNQFPVHSSGRSQIPVSGNRYSPNAENASCMPKPRSPVDGGGCQISPRSKIQEPRGKASPNVNFLTPQYQPPNRENLRPQAISTGGKYQTAANLNCPRPQRQPVSQRVTANDQCGKIQRGCAPNDQQDYNNEMQCMRNREPEMEMYDPDADGEACEPMPPC